MTAYDCNTLVRSFGIVSLLAGSDNAGPYVIRVGSVIVGAFGFARDGEASDFVDKCAHHQQLTAYNLARVAFEAIMLYADADGDPSGVRQIARAACRASRKLWPVLGYGTTEAIRETHYQMVNDDAEKASARMAA